MVEYAMQLFGHLQIMSYWYGLTTNNSSDFYDKYDF